MLSRLIVSGHSPGVRHRRAAIALTWGLLLLALILFWLLTGPVEAARAADDAPEAAQVWTVCPAGPPDCTYTVIQDAVDAASEGDVIKVAAGTYSQMVERGELAQVVYLNKTVTIRGGYTAPDFSEPSDPEANPTTLDAHSSGRALYITGNISPTIEGLRMTRGVALRRGGGVYVDGSHATLRRNIVFDNRAGEGGGIALYNSDADLRENVVVSNYNTSSGLGVGAGVYLQDSNALLRGNSIISNTTSIGSRYGGGLYLYRSDATLDGNVISFNNAYRGAGLFLDSSAPTLVNNVIADNSSLLVGGALIMRDSSPRLLHNTIARNTAGWGYGVYLWGDGNTMWLTNTIFVSHTVGIGVWSGNTAYLESTLWHGNGDDWSGDGAIYHNNDYTGDPAFVDPGAGDYHIRLGSAARDKGMDAGVYADMDGEPRPAGLGYDLGADEFHGPGVAVTKQASPDPVTAGAKLTYTLRVTNNGTVSLTTIVSDVLPGQVTPSGVLTWTPPSILPGDAWTETVAVTVEVGYAGPLTNVVRVSTEEGAAGVYTSTIRAEEAIAGLEASNDSPTMLGEPTTLTATVAAGSHVSYTWAFRDGELGSGAVVSHTYPAPGVYTAVVTAVNSVSELTATTAVTVDEAIAGLEATNDSPTALGEPTLLTATVTAGSHVTYTWAFGDGELGSGAVVSHTYPAPGVYTGAVTAGNSVSELTATTTVTVDEAIAGLEAINDSPTVFGEPTTLTATVSAGSHVTYAWAFGDGEAGSGAVVSHTYPSVGVYTAVVNAGNSVSELTATTAVTVDEAIAGLEVSNDSPTVLGSPTTLTATVAAGSNVTYTWAFGDGGAGSGAAVSHTYPAIGVYTAVVTACNSVSILTATTPVTVAEPISGLVVVNDSPTVLGDPTTFTATVAAGSDVTYTWNLGDGTVGQYVGAVHGEEASRQEEASEPFVLTHVYPAVGVCTAIFTASNALGELTATTTVTISDIPIDGLEALNDSPTVLGEPTALAATVTAGSNVTYTWAFGDGEIGGGAVVTHTYTAVGIYAAVVTASNSVGLLTATTTVEIARPTIYIYLPLVLRE
jgi:uncharacterized repeat protein (TIGR01451 family)